MRERHPTEFLRALRRLARQVSLYPEEHPTTVEAVQVAADAATALMAGDRSSVLSVLGNAFYADGSILPHTSLEHHMLIREFQERGLDSIALTDPVSDGDLFDLAAFVAGVADDLPADGTIRLNEVKLSPEAPDGHRLAGLRESYRGSIDALRVVTESMQTQGSFELTAVVDAVESLFESTVTHSAASLLLSTVKSHDQYTYYHSVNTCILALALGRIIGVAKEDLVSIGVGAVLHDIGKVAVSPAVLNYPGRLDAEQWKEIELHPQEGALAIMAAGGTGHQIAATVALEHHARFDGSGYPHVQRATRPHVFSRMVTVVDVYDALTTRRSYRRAETPTRTLELLLRDAGSHFDPDVARIFVQMMGIYPPGSLLELNDGSTALVVERVEPDEAFAALAVTDSVGHEIDEPIPVTLTPDRVVRQVLPDQVGVDPAAWTDVLETPQGNEPSR